MSFGLFAHALDFFFVEIGGIGDTNMLGFTCGFVMGGDFENAGGIDIKSDFDLRHAAGSGRSAVQNKAT